MYASVFSSMLMEIAFKSHIKIVTILYLSILSARIVPWCVRRWHYKNIHRICPPGAFVTTKCCQTPLHTFQTLTNSLIKIYLRGFHWQMNVVPGHRLLTLRPLCRPLSLHGISARAGVQRPTPTSQHTLRGYRVWLISP